MVQFFHQFSFVKWLLLLLLLLPVLASAMFGETRLKVHIPQSLSRNPLGYPHQESLFGIPPYGGAIAGPLYYVDSEFCNLGFGPKPRYYPSPPIEGQPFLLMVNRGGCSFVKKVRNAQHRGASGVLIADNICLCTDQLCLNQTQSQACEPQEPFMADDGSGSDVSIPSFLVPKHDAEDVFIRTIMDKGIVMRVEMDFPPPPEIIIPPALPLPNLPPEPPSSSSSSSSFGEASPKVVLYELWMNPTDALTKKFLWGFSPAAKALQSRTRFAPHFAIIDGITSRCQGSGNRQKEGSYEDAATPNKNQTSDNAVSPCFDMCTNQGRYCAPDPDGQLFGGASGADVVTESLRQLCIWSLYDNADATGTDTSKKPLWWEYALYFQKECVSNSLFHNGECSDNAQRDVGVSVGAVADCMDNSGGLVDQGKNNKLENELIIAKSQGIFATPSLHIDQKPYNGPLEPGAVFGALCSAFSVMSMPSICSQCKDCFDPIACIKSGGSCASRPVMVVNPIPSVTSAAASSSSATMSSSSSSSNQQPMPMLQYDESSTGGVSVSTFVLSVLLVAAVAVLLGVWHLKRTRTEMRERVRFIVSDYMPLNDDGVVNFTAAAESPTAANSPTTADNRLFSIT